MFILCNSAFKEKLKKNNDSSTPQPYKSSLGGVEQWAAERLPKENGLWMLFEGQYNSSCLLMAKSFCCFFDTVLNNLGHNLELQTNTV